MVLTKSILELQQLDVMLQPGHEVPLPASSGILEQRIVARLQYQLSLLINRVYGVTKSLPTVGDELVLEAVVLDAWHAAPGGVPARWRVAQRSYLTPDKKLHVAYRLYRMLGSGPGEEADGEALLVDELLAEIPTKAGQRSLQRWLSDPIRPIRTWAQLARYGHELPDERGFNGRQHLPLIEKKLQARGLALL